MALVELQILPFECLTPAEYGVDSAFSAKIAELRSAPAYPAESASEIEDTNYRILVCSVANRRSQWREAPRTISVSTTSRSFQAWRVL